MPVIPPPAPAKGTRHPGAGRQTGTPNRITVELRTFASQLVNDAAYQHRLRRDFRLRRVHPAIESLIWHYQLGKPSQRIEVDARYEVSAKYEEDKRILASLDLPNLEQVLTESEALMDRARALSRARSVAAGPQSTTAEAAGQRTEAHDARRPPPSTVQPEHPPGSGRPH
jgi:hypothetical protein